MSIGTNGIGTCGVGTYGVGTCGIGTYVLEPLARDLRRVVCTTKVKITEKVLKTLRQALVKADPWEGGLCEDPSCHPCLTGEGKTRCRRRNITYINQCNKCKCEGKTTLYLGESSNSLKERMQQHTEDFFSKDTESHMRSHLMDEHGGGTLEDFGSRVMRTHLTALERQIHEAWMIKSFRKGTLLNSKMEYNHGIIPALHASDTLPKLRASLDACKKHSISRRAIIS